MMTVVVGKLRRGSAVSPMSLCLAVGKKQNIMLEVLLHRDSFTSELALQMHIVRLWLESEMLLSTHQCWVSCISEQPSKNDHEPIKASLVCHDVSVFCKTS